MCDVDGATRAGNVRRFVWTVASYPTSLLGERQQHFQVPKILFTRAFTAGFAAISCLQFYFSAFARGTVASSKVFIWRGINLQTPNHRRFHRADEASFVRGGEKVRVERSRRDTRNRGTTQVGGSVIDYSCSPRSTSHSSSRLAMSGASSPPFPPLPPPPLDLLKKQNRQPYSSLINPLEQTKIEYKNAKRPDEKRPSPSPSRLASSCTRRFRCGGEGGS